MRRGWRWSRTWGEPGERPRRASYRNRFRHDQHRGLHSGRRRRGSADQLHGAGRRPDPELALRRYEVAFSRLGFDDVRYAYEPIAAAFFFARTLSGDATVLVGDFGGGTSDFSIVRFHREAGEVRSTALANAGV